MSDLIPCNKCTAICCRQVTVSLDPLTSESDYQEFYWLIVHKNITICIDEQWDWWMEVATDCSQLGKHNECLIYDQRPQICRDHELDSCEMNGEGDAYPFMLKSKEELDVFIEKYYVKKGNKYVRKED